VPQSEVQRESRYDAPVVLDEPAPQSAAVPPRFCEITSSQPTGITQEKVGNRRTKRARVVEVPGVLSVELNDSKLAGVAGEVDVLLILQDQQAGLHRVGNVLPRHIVLVLKRVVG